MAIIMVFAMAPCMAFAAEDQNQEAVDIEVTETLDEMNAAFDQEFDTDTDSSLADAEYIPVKVNFGTKHKAFAKTVYNYLKKTKQII